MSNSRFKLQISITVVDWFNELHVPFAERFVESDMILTADDLGILELLAAESGRASAFAAVEAVRETRQRIAARADDALAAQAEHDRVSNGPEWTEGLGDDEDDDQ